MAEVAVHDCPRCKGRGVCTAFRSSPLPCNTCRGSGEITVDPAAIRAALAISRGQSAGHFRRSRPALPEDGGVYGAAYVWRMIRFHTGVDLCLPVMAPMYIGIFGTFDDNSRKIVERMEALADELGTHFFGKAATYRAAARWGQVLFGSQAVIGEHGASREITFGQLADVLGVHGVDGFAPGGFTESPEATAEAYLDGDGNVDRKAVETMLSQPAHAD